LDHHSRSRHLWRHGLDPRGVDRGDLPPVASVVPDVPLVLRLSTNGPLPLHRRLARHHDDLPTARTHTVTPPAKGNPRFRGGTRFCGFARTDHPGAAIVTDQDFIFDVQHGTLRFGGVTSLNDVSLQQSRGEILSVIGPNGAGKTSLF